MEMFPEIFKHKIYNTDSRWFPITDEGNNIRISIFEQAIKETTKVTK